MISNKRFFTLSERLRSFGSYINADQFKGEFKIGLYNDEDNAVIKQYVIDNTPYCFKEFPILFSNIKTMISLHLDVPYESIFLIGSAKTGFSIDPCHYGKKFSEKSDLDFSIVNSNLFEKISNEAKQWLSDYKSKLIDPTSQAEKRYWNENVELLPKNISKGFVDEWKIPRNTRYAEACKIGHVMFLIKANLENFDYFKVSKCSARIYKDQTSFHNQTIMSIRSVMEHRP